MASVLDRQARASRWRTDLWWVAVATLGCYLVAGALDLQESLTHRVARFETWEMDELPLSLLVLACGLVWFALRRRRELQAQLDLRDHCAVDDHASMLGAAGRANAATQELQQLVNQVLRRLRPANLDTLSLGAALPELCESWRKRTGFDCRFRHEGSTDALGDTVDITIYRVAQDALTNVTRHARARSVRVALSRVSSAEVTLRGQDDGQGMDPGVATRGLGLHGADERAAPVGGELQVRSAPGMGLTLVLRIPLPQTAVFVPPAPPLSNEPTFRAAA